MKVLAKKIMDSDLEALCREEWLVLMSAFYKVHVRW